jgi:uncharacterized protein YecT (DUF1311 family)
MRIIVITLILSVALVGRATDENKGPTRLAAAPNGEYAIDWIEGEESLRVVAKSSGVPIANFKVGQTGEGSTPLPFISPDSNWVFVVTAAPDAEPPASFDHSSVLVRRTNSGNGFEPATPDRFDKAAWEFLDHELKLRKNDLPADAQRVYCAEFIDWSRDSARLLLRVGGGAWSPSKSEWVEAAAYTWYCYFNTRSGKFELTERLRAIDTNPDRKNLSGDDATALRTVVVNAESIGEEGPQQSAKELFDAADKRLNEAYEKVIAKMEPAKRESFREEQRAWLIARDTEAQVAALQRWTSGFEATARIYERKANSTQVRVAEIEKLLAK